MLPNPAAMFLRRNRGLVDGIVGYLNKQQTLHSYVLQLLDGKEHPVNDIKADLVLAMVDKSGPQVLERILLAMDKEMDKVFDAIAVAVKAAAEQAQAQLPPGLNIVAGEDPAEPEPNLAM